MNAPTRDAPPLKQRISDTVKRVERRIRAEAAGETVTLSVDDFSAEFYVDTSLEYDRYENVTDVFREHVSQLLGCLESGDVFWDVGACTGRYGCLAAQTGAEVIAIEPNPHQHSRLAENLELNNIDQEIRPYALADDAGQLPLQGMSVIGAAAHLGRDPETVHVAVRSGDELISEGLAPRPDVVKLDVDGAEIAALDGLSETLTDCYDVFVEVHEHHGVWWDAVVERLIDHIFDIGSIGERNVGGTTKIRGSKS